MNAFEQSSLISTASTKARFDLNPDLRKGDLKLSFIVFTAERNQF